MKMKLLLAAVAVCFLTTSGLLANNGLGVGDPGGLVVEVEECGDFEVGAFEANCPPETICFFLVPGVDRESIENEYRMRLLNCLAAAAAPTPQRVPRTVRLRDPV